MRIKITVSDDRGNEAAWTSLRDIESPAVNKTDRHPTVATVLEAIVCDSTASKVFVMCDESKA